jgi:hypothetical protein
MKPTPAYYTTNAWQTVAETPKNIFMFLELLV